MALDFGDEEQLFSHSKEVDTGMGKERIGQATIVVSLDGTGDTDNIQDAVDMLPSEGGAVYIKEGNYTITKAIDLTSDNITLAGASASTIITTTVADYLIDISGDNIIIEKIKFIGNKTSPQYIYNRSGDNITIRDCYFYQTYNGILSHVGTGILSNNWIKDTGNNGIELGTAAVSAGSNFVMGNKIDGCDNEGIYLLKSTSNVIIGNNIRSNGAWGINGSAAATYNVIIGNNLFNNTSGDLNINGANCETAHNVIT